MNNGGDGTSASSNNNASGIKNLGQKIGADKLAEDLVNPRKGFKFFIE